MNHDIQIHMKILNNCLIFLLSSQMLSIARKSFKFFFPRVRDHHTHQLAQKFVAKTYHVGRSHFDNHVHDFGDEIPAVAADYERAAHCGRFNGAQNGLDKVLREVGHLEHFNCPAQTTGAGLLAFVRHRRDQDRVHRAAVTRVRVTTKLNVDARRSCDGVGTVTRVEAATELNGEAGRTLVKTEKRSTTDWKQVLCYLE